MAKVTLSSIGAGKGDIDLLNANFTAISTAMDNTLSRDGTATNTMGASLDMNSNRIINLPAPQANSDAARKVDVTGAVQGDLQSVSTTSVLIGTGSKTFTTGADKFFVAGGFVVVSSDADPTNYMHGQITSYSGTTLIVNVTTTGGSGTLADWTIQLSGDRGATGANGPMTGPVSSTDNAVTRWDGVGGDTVQDSSVIIDDSDAVTGVTSLTVDNININGNSIISTDTNGDINLTPDGTGVNVVTNNINPADDATDSLGTSTKRFADLFTSGGVYLGGTGAANYLTDYEEGTFTAAFTSGTGTVTINPSYDTGAYTKVGNKVYFTGEFRVSSVSTPTGTLTLTGLPFTANNSTQGTAAVSIFADSLTSGAGESIIARILQNTSAIQILKFNSGAAAALAGDTQASSTFILEGSYFV
jgi:hypothetical protein